MARDGPHRIRVLSDRSEPEVRDARVAVVVHKDVWLAGCQHSEVKSRVFTYSFEVPMNHVARVEVAEALNDIG